MGLKMERVFLVFMVIFSSLDGARCFHCDIDKAKQATLDMAYCLSKLRHLRLQKCSIIKHIFNDCFDKQSLDDCYTTRELQVERRVALEMANATMFKLKMRDKSAFEVSNELECLYEKEPDLPQKLAGEMCSVSERIENAKLFKTCTLDILESALVGKGRSQVLLRTCEALEDVKESCLIPMINRCVKRKDRAEYAEVILETTRTLLDPLLAKLDAQIFISECDVFQRPFITSSSNQRQPLFSIFTLLALASAVILY